MVQIVEGGCIDPSGGTRLRATLTKQGVELRAAHLRRFVYAAGSPWRALRRVLRRVRSAASTISEAVREASRLTRVLLAHRLELVVAAIGHQRQE